MPQNYPFPNNGTISQNDFGLSGTNPGFMWGGSEGSAIFFEDREVNGALYRVQNAHWNRVANKWVAVDITKPCSGIVINAFGAVQTVYQPAGVTPFSTWTITSGTAPNVFDAAAFGAKGDCIITATTVTGTDDTAAIQAALNAAGVTVANGASSATVFLHSPNTYLCNGNLSVPAGVTLSGGSVLSGFPSTVKSAIAGTPYLNYSTTLAITNAVNPFIQLNGACTLQDLTFYYPNQVDPQQVAPAPTVYPYTINVPLSVPNTLRRCVFVNPYNAVHVASSLYIVDCTFGELNLGVVSDNNANGVVFHNVGFATLWSLGTEGAYPGPLDAWVIANPNNASLWLDKGQYQGTNLTFFGRYRCFFLNGTNGGGAGNFSNVFCDTNVQPIYSTGTGTSGGGTYFPFVFNGLQVGSSSGASTVPIITAGPNPSVIRVNGGKLWGTAWLAPFATFQSTASIISYSNVEGVNQIGALNPPAVPASGVALFNPFPFAVLVTISPDAGNTNLTIQTSANTPTTFQGPQHMIAQSSQVPLGPGQQIKLTWTGGAAPTWIWFAV